MSMQIALDLDWRDWYKVRLLGVVSATKTGVNNFIKWFNSKSYTGSLGLFFPFK